MRSSPEGWLMGLGALLAGMCARRRSHFLLSRQKKVTKEKATPLAVSPALRFGATCDARAWGGAAELAARLQRSAQTTAASQSTKHGLAAQPMPAPRPALLGTARGEVKSTRAIAALGLRLVSAAASRGGFLAPSPAGGRGRGEGGCAWVKRRNRQARWLAAFHEPAWAGIRLMKQQARCAGLIYS